MFPALQNLKLCLKFLSTRLGKQNPLALRNRRNLSSMFSPSSEEVEDTPDVGWDCE